MRRASTIAATLLGLALGASSCSFIDDYDDFRIDDDAAVPLTPETFFQALAESVCAKALRCERKLGLGAVLEAICHPAGADYVIDDLIPVIVGATFDQVVARQCLDAAAASVLDCAIGTALIPESCLRVFIPTVQVGNPCSGAGACIDGYCELLPNGCGGTCRALKVLNDPCTKNEECIASLRCRASTCQPLGVATDPCDESVDCGAQLWCGTGNTCQVLPNLGESCVYTLGGDPCRGELVCPLFGGQCMQGAAENASCSNSMPCAPGLRCPSITNPTCVALSLPGDACSSAANCPLGFECVSTRCEPLPTAGQACSPTLPCLEGVCMTTCTLLADGQPCNGENGPVGRQCQGWCRTVSPGVMQCAPKSMDLDPCMEDYECRDGAHCTPDQSICLTCP